MTTQQAETTLEKKGRRLFFRNAPFSSKDILRDGGAKWDAEERSWYVGTQRKALATRLVTEVQASVVQNKARSAACGRYAKVADSWCVRMPVGWVPRATTNTVMVRKARGEEKQETLGARVQESPQRHLYAVVRDRKPSRRATTPSYKRTSCKECRGPLVDCSYEQADDTYCGSCLYDER